MPSNIRRIDYNTRERILSADANDATTLMHAAMVQTLAALCQKDDPASTIDRGGVVSGLVTTSAGGLNVAVSAGIALKKQSPPTSLDPIWAWIQLLASETVDLAPSVDGGNPRWVCLEIEAGNTVEASSTRDIWQPATGTFTTASIPKRTGPDPAIVVNEGTPAAVPTLPSGSANRIPLAYVYLAAAAGSVAATDIVLCRPIMTAQNTNQVEGYYGGGLDVLTRGATSVEIRKAVARNAVGITYQVPHGTTIDAATGTNTFWLNGQTSSTANNRPVYAYFGGAPYPSGYDADIRNEAREVYTTGTRIPSLVPGGAFVFFSSTAPTAEGFGPSASSADPTWGGTGGATYYLGQVAQDQALGGFLAQRTSRDGLVTFGRGNASPAEASAFECFSQTENSSASGAIAVNPRRSTASPANNLVGSEVIDFVVSFAHTVGSGAAGSVFVVEGDVQAPAAGGLVFGRNLSAASAGAVSATYVVRSATTVEAVVNSGAGDSTGEMWTAGYRDPILGTF